MNTFVFALHYLLQPLLNRRRVPLLWRRARGPFEPAPLSDSCEPAARTGCGRPGHPQPAVFTSVDARIALTAVSPRVWRVVVSRPGESPYRSWSVVEDAEEPLGVERRAAGFTVSTAGGAGESGRGSPPGTPGLAAEIDRRSGRLSFHFAGTLLHRDEAAPAAWSREGWVRCVTEAPVREWYVGFGERSGPLFKNGRRLVMWNTDERFMRTSSDPLYQSCPLQIAVRADGRAHGIFYDNPSYSVFRVGGHGERPRTRYAAEGGPLCYYVLAGPSLGDVLSQFTRLTGRPPLPPYWALGHHHSRWEEEESAARIERTARLFRERRIPCDVLHLDIGHMEGHRCFTWRRGRFPDPGALVGTLHGLGFRAVVMTDPGLKRDPDWDIYREGVAGDHFCRRADGGVFHAPVWAGQSAFPDYLRGETRTWWGGLYRRYTDVGIDGFWIDMNEPSLFIPRSTMPDSVVHRPDGEGAGPEARLGHRRAHNLYGLMMAAATRTGLLTLRPGLRPFLLTRSGFAGVQRYAASWTGDNRSNFGHYRMSIPMLLNMGLSGQAMVGPDTGGFWGSPAPELMARWFQLAAVYPFCRNHTKAGTPPQEPWAFGEEVEEIVRASLGLRYSLLPYLYTCLSRSHADGRPVLRPLFMEFPGDGRCLEAANAETELMVGHALLAAPVLRAGARARPVYLPAGGPWYDYHDGSVLPGGCVHAISAPLTHMPLFARAGSVVPTVAPCMTSEEARTSVLVLRVYPGREIRGAVYLDDGETTRYEAGERAEIRVRGGADSRPGPEAEITLEITREGDESLPLLGAHRGLRVLVAAPQTPAEAVRAVGTAAPAGGENRPGGAVARPLVTAEGCAVDGVGRSGGFVRFGISELRMPARLVLHLSSP